MTARQFNSFSEITDFIWDLANLLRGNYKEHEYGKIILPLTVLRRLDCVLAPTKDEVLERAAELEGGPVRNKEPILNRVSGVGFHNTSRLDFGSLLGDPSNIAPHLHTYIESFSSDAREIIERFSFTTEIEKLDREDLLYLLIQEFASVDLHPSRVSNSDMGSIFEELIRRFSEQSNETAGHHFTPREVIRLKVHLLFGTDASEITKPGIVKTLYDPAAGTGGMLSEAEDYLHEINPDARLEVFGQELNEESYAICKADMLIKGHEPDHIVLGNSFSEDGHKGRRFDYMLSNPPFGVSWKKVKRFIEKESTSLGFDGRFGAGTPRVNDGSLLFLQHMISKIKPAGTRISIVFNASPLFKGGAASGESNIRKWIVENDWLEAVIALPDELFYNTGIFTFIWVVTNDKSQERQGKVQLIDARDLFERMPTSLGNKRKRLSLENIAEIAQIHEAFIENERSMIFENEDFGYQEIVIERPLRMSFSVTEDRIEELKGEGAFEQLNDDARGKLLNVLETMRAEGEFTSRERFLQRLEQHVTEAGINLRSTLARAAMGVFGRKDPDAEICRDADGNPEADTDLRDRERVPLKEDIHEYFRREVDPFLEEAWLNEDMTRVGYEIPFSRYFYVFDQPVPLEDLEQEIRDLEATVVGALEEIWS